MHLLQDSSNQEMDPTLCLIRHIRSHPPAQERGPISLGPPAQPPPPLAVPPPTQGIISTPLPPPPSSPSLQASWALSQDRGITLGMRMQEFPLLMHQVVVVVLVVVGVVVL